MDSRNINIMNRFIFHLIAVVLAITSVNIGNAKNAGVAYDGNGDVSPERDDHVKMELLAVGNFLQEVGIDLDTCKMVLSDQDENMTLFNDRRHKISVLIANHRFHAVLDNPVLYWTTESLMWKIDKSLKMFKYYSEQLTALDEGALLIPADTSATVYTPNRPIVSPILEGIRLNQGDPYNLLCPELDGHKTIVGCVSIACAQIMFHYRYPAEGRGIYQYPDKKKSYIITKDFSKVKNDWSKYWMPDYTQPCDSMHKMFVSQFVSAVSASLGAEFGDEVTYAKSVNIKSALVHFWDYSISCRHCKTNNADTIIGLIRQELDAGRPAIVSDEGHTYVADGAYGDYLHFNLGWGGHCNGYYRMPFVQGNKEKYPLKDVIIGIEPNHDNDNRSLTIKLEKANTLRTKLTTDQLLHTTSLTLIGILGNDDVKVLRQMLGATVEDNLFLPIGKLQELDLRQAKFKTDKKTTYREEVLHGDGGSSWWNTVNGKKIDIKHYDFDNMTVTDWREYCAVDMNKSEGELITFNDGICTRHCYVESRAIGSYMFAGCENLRSIKLPENTTVIGHGAFDNCRLLTDIELPQKVETVRNYAFSNTRLLKMVCYRNSGPHNFAQNAFKYGYYGAVFKYKRM